VRIFEAPPIDGKPRKRHVVRGGSTMTLCERTVFETWREVPDAEPTCRPCTNELAEARARGKL
jgi:hypothetical protein